MPEETNRKAIDHISDVLITTTKLAKKFLLKEGIKRKIFFIQEIQLLMQYDIPQKE